MYRKVTGLCRWLVLVSMSMSKLVIAGARGRRSPAAPIGCFLTSSRLIFSSYFIIFQTLLKNAEAYSTANKFKTCIECLCRCSVLESPATPHPTVSTVTGNYFHSPRYMLGRTFYFTSINAFVTLPFSSPCSTIRLNRRNETLDNLLSLPTTVGATAGAHAWT